MGLKIHKSDYSKHLISKPVEGNVLVEKVQKPNGDSAIVSIQDVTVNPGILVSKQKHMELEVGGGRTINIGNFESARIQVSVRMPTDPENLMMAYEFATNWVSERIQEATKDVQG